MPGRYDQARCCMELRKRVLSCFECRQGQGTMECSECEKRHCTWHIINHRWCRARPEDTHGYLSDTALRETSLWSTLTAGYTPAGPCETPVAADTKREAAEKVKQAERLGPCTRS